MSSRRYFITGVVLAPAALSRAWEQQSTPATFSAWVPDRIQDRYTPAPLDSQQIGGILGERLKVNLQKRLLDGVNLEPLLAGYRKRPGLQTWIGEHAAKFIDAGTNVSAYSGDQRLKQKVDTAVRELLATKLPDGYLGTYAAAERWTNWDVWAHKYNLIALLNYYGRTGYEPALAACRKMGDLLVKTYGEGEGQRSIVLNDWHVGMANSSVLEPMVGLYRYTGDPRYLEFCRYIVRAWDGPKGPRIVSTLLETGSVRRVANNKGYEMMSNFVGLLDLYRITGDETYLKPVLIAWQDIVSKRLYLTGTATWGEHFQEDYFLRADDVDKSPGVGEGCVTTTWLQMNLHLLRLTGEAKYADQLERTVYNALLAAQHPASGLICYFTPLNGIKRYGAVSQGVDGVSCCTSSIPRGLALVPAIAWGGRKGGIAINFYTPGTVRLPVSGTEATIVSTTTFPAGGNAELEIRIPRPASFTLSLRVPSWSRRFTAQAGGKPFTGEPGTYLEIERNWSASDRVSIDMDMTTRVHSGSPAYPGSVAIQRGPQVLAVDSAWNRNIEIWLAGVAMADRPVPELKPSSSPLSARGLGSQAYETPGFIGNAGLGYRKTPLVFVPVADAGQRGQEYRVWIQGS
jgi:DUF1680 family protein